MKSRMFLIVWLVAVWVALWRDLSAANIVSGLLIAVGVSWLWPHENDGDTLQFRPVAMLRVVATSFVAIVRANLYVAWEVITPKNDINEGVVAVELASSNPIVITMVSHAIILAPGTMVIDIDKSEGEGPTILYVHVLHLRSVEAIRNEVLELEALALAALSASSDPATSPTGEGR